MLRLGISRRKINSLLLLVSLVDFFSPESVLAEESCQKVGPVQELKQSCEVIVEAYVNDADTIFPNIQEAISVQEKIKKTARYIATNDETTPQFPSFSACKPSFFRVATVDKEADKIISTEGWKSGWVRREEELEKAGKPVENNQFDALPKSASFEDRIVQYVGVKDVLLEFPKHSSVVGVLENPIRSLSVGYHTGYNNGMKGYHMHLDEIEVGPCARAPECKKLTAVNTSEVFSKRGLTSRFSTEGEWAIEGQIPKACITATYRIKFGKVDKKCYSDANNNCNFSK